MLSIDEVLVMAFPIWRDNQTHMPTSLYEDEEVLKPVDAATALRIFEELNPDPVFWDNVDRIELQTRFVSHISYRLSSKGLSYDGEMQERQKLAAVPT